MAFATFDEVTPHDLFRPSITCVVQPAAAIAACATELLVSRIEKSAPDKIVEARFAATLKIGESSAAFGIPALSDDIPRSAAGHA
jgi:LacI family transcriptional regulator